ncbi:MAG: GTP cyclohydrolase I FolE2, partial [Armatimonadetes bacterium]|nr:GTP cyclohydrolase I FolE2 [Armatimonadota bacterium]
MRDVASERDDRGITIDRVGIRDLHLPVRIRQKTGNEARVVGVFDATVELPHYERGTHMSRFVEVLMKWSKRAVSQTEMKTMLGELTAVFQARAAYVSLGFKYFLGKTTPASGIQCQLDYECQFDAKMLGSEFAFAVEVEVPVL